MSADERWPSDPHVARQLMARLAVLAVQGEQLQALCDELEPLLRELRREPRFEPAAAVLAGTLQAVAGMARDIAGVTETLGRGLQPLQRRAPRGEPR